MDEEFSRDENYGPMNVIVIKSGTLRCGSGCDCRAKVSHNKKNRKIGMISKKKKKSHRMVGLGFVLNLSPKLQKFC